MNENYELKEVWVRPTEEWEYVVEDAMSFYNGLEKEIQEKLHDAVKENSDILKTTNAFDDRIPMLYTEVDLRGIISTDVQMMKFLGLKFEIEFLEKCKKIHDMTLQNDLNLIIIKWLCEHSGINFDIKIINYDSPFSRLGKNRRMYKIINIDKLIKANAGVDEE